LKIFSLLLLAICPAAFATNIIITFTSLPATQGNGTSANETNSADYTYNGEAIATIAGIPAQDLVCDDFDQTTNMPSGPLDFSEETISNLSGALFTSGFVTGLTSENGGSMTKTQAYDTAAVLLTALEALGAETSANRQAVADYNYAIWDMMEPGAADGAILDGALDANALSYLNNAFTAVTQGTATPDYAKLEILTPTSTGQEFLELNISPTPEPASWVLMVALGFLLCIPMLSGARTHACSVPNHGDASFAA